MNHTILLAHGSRDVRWTEPFEVIASLAKQRSKSVSLAYMELAAPDLKQAKASGAVVITVLPLFLLLEKHVN